MTFPEYFQAVQALITKEIDLPFDCPFSDTWIFENLFNFRILYINKLTPEEAVKMHFDWIDREALLMKGRKSKSII